MTTQTKNKIWDRVITNWKSTLLAIVVAVLCGLALYMKWATWDQLIGFLTTIGLLSWVRDTVFKP